MSARWPIQRAVVALAGVLLMAGLRADAWADDDDDAPIATKMRFAERATDLTASTNVTSLFDGATYNNLENGFPSTVVIRLWVYPRGQTDAVSFALLRRRLVYDLWDEVYVVRLEEPGGAREVRVKYKAEALKLLTTIEGIAIAPLKTIPYEAQYQLAVVAELNPVSKETLAEARRWLSQGTGGGMERGGSFFGSFVSVFVNLKIPEADRVLRLRSQPFYRPKPKK